MRHIRRFAALGTLTALFVLLVLPGITRAQEPVRVLYSDADSQMLALIEGFKKGMALIRPIELVELPSERETLRKQLQELNKAKPALVVALGTRAAMVARELLTDTPVLFTYAVDTQTTQLRGPRMRGINYTIRAQEQIAMLRKIYPGMRRVGVVYNPSNSGFEVNWMEEAAREAGVAMFKFKVDVDQDVERALANLAGKVEMLWVPDDPMILKSDNLRELLRFSLRESTPLYTFNPVHVNAGASISLSPSGHAAGLQLAEMASRVLLGSPIEQLPMEWPKNYELGINLAILKRIGRLEDVAVNALVFAAEEKHDVKIVR